jgi:8-oxo-dGTP pyrophosphatase MutT (NUDIX family)
VPDHSAKKSQTVPFVLPSVKSPQPRCSKPTLIHRNPREHVSLVRAEFDGFFKDYYVVEFGPRAGLVAVSEGKVLLAAQYRLLINDIAWEIPGGKVDEGEMPIDAAQRECLEETGFFCTDLKPLISFRPGLDNVENVNSVFYSESVEQRRPFTPDPAEALAIAWVPIEDCVDLVLRGGILDCLTVSALLAYSCFLQRRQPVQAKDTSPNPS